jgi:succinyl-CoA synthetase alpha subunit
MIFAASGQVIVQGMTASLGPIVAPLMQQYGTRLVAGVAAGSGGQVVAGLPVMDLVQQVVGEFGAIATSVICVPPYQVLDAAREAMQSGIRQLVVITSGVPPLDIVKLVQMAQASGTLIVGPNSPGVIVPGKLLLGIHPPQFYAPGKIGLISGHGTLTYEVARSLSLEGLGQSIAVSIGADAIVGSTLSQWLQILETDDSTEAIVLVGKVGRDVEEILNIAQSMSKPIVSYIPAPPLPRPRRLGHANAILESHAFNDREPSWVTVTHPTKDLQCLGVTMAASPGEIPQRLRQAMMAVFPKSA